MGRGGGGRGKGGGVNNYFVTKRDLDEERDRLFTTLAKMFSEKDKFLSKKLEELRNEFLLLIDTIGQQSYQLGKSAPSGRKRGAKRMSERPFEEILKELVDHIMNSNDERAIILIDELEQSAEKFKEGKKQMKLQLNRIHKKAEEFLKQQENEKKDKEKIEKK